MEYLDLISNGLPQVKEVLYKEILQQVPKQGLSEKTMQQACINKGYDQNFYKIVFPGGVLDFIDHYFALQDEAMLTRFKDLDFADMSIRQKIIKALEIRIDLYAKNKKLHQDIFSHALLPFNFLRLQKIAWRAADLIWRYAVNDRSTDYNYYTKRTILVGVMMKVGTYWLSDDSEGHSETRGFIVRQVEGVIKFFAYLKKFK